MKFTPALKHTLIGLSIGVVSVSLLFGAYLLGAHHRQDPAETWADAVAKASHNGATLEKIFPGPAGLMGLVVHANRPGATPQIAWGIPGKVPLVIIGGLFDPKGQDITRIAARAQFDQGAPEQTAQQAQPTQSPFVDPSTTSAPNAGNDIPVPAASANSSPGQASNRDLLSPDELWQGVTHAGAVHLGASNPKRVVYIFADANCSYCHDLYTRIAPLLPTLAKKGVGINWIPVAVLTQSSNGRGAALLNGGSEALAINENNFNVGGEEGGISPSNDLNLQRAVLANTALMLRDGQPAITPTLIWRDETGVRVYPGEPPTFGALVSILENGGQKRGQG